MKKQELERLIENKVKKALLRKKLNEIETPDEVSKSDAITAIKKAENIKKPIAKVIGEDGNVFNLIGICSRSLRKAGQGDRAKEMSEKIFKAGSYDEALAIMAEYCDLR